MVLKKGDGPAEGGALGEGAGPLESSGSGESGASRESQDPGESAGPFILEPGSPREDFLRWGGGKAANLAELDRLGYAVPDFFCISTRALGDFLRHNGLDAGPRENSEPSWAAFREAVLRGDMPPALAKRIGDALSQRGWRDQWLAVRSSGAKEDSAEHSFAGQYESFLYLRGVEAVLDAVRKCFASAFSARVLDYRLRGGLAEGAPDLAVIVQEMIEAESSGVAFSRDPAHPLDRDTVVIESVWGAGEGLVSGALDADRFETSRSGKEGRSRIAKKASCFRRSPTGGAMEVAVEPGDQDRSSLAEAQVAELRDLALRLEADFGSPQDCEWALCGGRIHVLQTRPLTTLPPASFEDASVNGVEPILWDNSNIVESFSGVTTPLTFSHAARSYEAVYRRYCRLMGVPEKIVQEQDPLFRNMLGLIRGRVYYNLGNWYRLLSLFPGSGSNRQFMESMMGVKQSLEGGAQSLFDFADRLPAYSARHKARVAAVMLYRLLRLGGAIRRFRGRVETARRTALGRIEAGMSYPAQVAEYHRLSRELLEYWDAPIINDARCMLYFGLLQKLTRAWLGEEAAASALHNDLMSGQGQVESTEPTKMLVRIAEELRENAAEKQWLLTRPPRQAWEEMRSGEAAPRLHARLREFLDRYGFRCMNELKLEEPDLHDDPSFALDAIAGYMRRENFGVREMEKLEGGLRARAEERVRLKLRGPRRWAYFRLARLARRAVKDREALRFDRTKIFGVVRRLFRAMGENLGRLGVLEETGDVFYLSVEELIAFAEGRALQGHLGALARSRRAEFERYRRGPAPPERFLTRGTVGAWLGLPQALADADLLKESSDWDDADGELRGTPCCAGVVEGTAKVVHSVDDARGLQGEILVTERTDPGWVPLFPNCSGLLVERGSQLSHSAVVAREMGLPAIVGIGGGLTRRIRSGQRIRMDGSTGKVELL